MDPNDTQQEPPRDPKLSGIMRSIKRGRNILPVMLLACYQKDSGVSISDQGQFILTPEEWEELKIEIDRFFSLTPHHEIYEHNTRRNRDIAPKEPEFTAQFTIPNHLNQQECGWVYLAAAQSRQGLKIRATERSLPVRFRQLSCEIRDAVTCLQAFHTKQPFALESAFHQYFAACRLDGEWFDLSLQMQEEMPALAARFCEVIEKGGDQ